MGSLRRTKDFKLNDSNLNISTKYAKKPLYIKWSSVTQLFIYVICFKDQGKMS
jgi:hypothetical protein